MWPGEERLARKAGPGLAEPGRFLPDLIFYSNNSRKSGKREAIKYAFLKMMLAAWRLLLVFRQESSEVWLMGQKRRERWIALERSRWRLMGSGK